MGYFAAEIGVAAQQLDRRLASLLLERSRLTVLALFKYLFRSPGGNGNKWLTSP